MDYKNHYNKLISNAINRKVSGYTESHHIIPRCLNGSDDSSNIVKLTPEEHYVAHQLLVKIHPLSNGVIYAALMMCVPVSNKNHYRKNNKRYGWLKRKYSAVRKQYMIKNNPTRGKYWITNGKISKVISINSPIPEGFIKGRCVIIREALSDIPSNKFCKECGKKITGRKTDYCRKHCHKPSLQYINKDLILKMYEDGTPLKDILNKFNWKTESNLTGFLRKYFPNRSKFIPGGRIGYTHR